MAVLNRWTNTRTLHVVDVDQHTILIKSPGFLGDVEFAFDALDIGHHFLDLVPPLFPERLSSFTPHACIA